MNNLTLFSSANAGAAQLKSGVSWPAWLAAVAVALADFVVQLILFCAFRERLPRVYEPCRYANKRLRAHTTRPGFWGWVVPLYSYKTGELLLVPNGMDAYFCLRYVRLLWVCFFMVSAVLLPVLLPIYVRANKPSLSGLDVVSFSDNVTSSTGIAALLAMSVLVAIFFACVIRGELMVFIHEKNKLLASRPYCDRVSARTIYFQRFGAALDRERVEAYFSQLGPVSEVWLNKDYGVLDKLLLKRQEIVHKLECALTSVIVGAAVHSDIKNERHQLAPLGTLYRDYVPDDKLPWHFEQSLLVKVESIPFYQAQLSQLTSEIEKMQTLDEGYTPGNSCFVAFQSQLHAQLLTEGLLVDTSESVCNDIEPSNIVWANVGLTRSSMMVRSMVSVILTLTVTLCWAFFVGLLGILSSLSYLVQLLHVGILPEGSAIDTLARALPPLVLGLLMSMVPRMFEALALYQGYITRGQAQLATQRHLFLFLFVQSFLVLSLSSGIFQLVYLALNSPLRIPDLVAHDLAKSANFFHLYLLTQGFQISGALLGQLGPLLNTFAVLPLVNWWAQVRGRLSARTLFEQDTRFVHRTVNWGSTYPPITVLAVISITYVPLSPVVAPTVLVSLSLVYMALKYRIVFGNISVFDSHGLYYPRALLQLFFGLYFMELCVIGRLAFHSEGRGVAHAAIMALVLILTVVAHRLIHISVRRALAWLPIQSGKVRQLPCAEQSDPESIGRQVKHLFDSMDMVYDALVPEQRAQVDHIAYQAPAMRQERPCLWIPRDELGVCDDIIAEMRRNSPFLQVSSDGCRVENGQVVYDRAPPDYSVMDHMVL